tara:strand:+ start:569 stop:826 length:258 start_codon:yes stop_codon:yes gene_type:complete
MATVQHVTWCYPETTSDDWVEFSPTNLYATFMSYWKLDNKGEAYVAATKPFNREPHLTVKEILEAMKDYYEEQSPRYYEEKSCNA